ncbi:hypothetical protein SDC9_176531 [bioreactor metagenome]|uniref:SIS domain-containing protein n=1 Tax=bioreactor metagenome TaxID=1076179 RepID=A0A645GT08_9ZZZZ
MKKAIQMIDEANNIISFGLRGSYSLAHHLVATLGEVRGNIRLIHGVGYLYPEEVNSINEGDVCIAFAFSRYVKMSVDLIYWMRKRGAKIILITDAKHVELKDKVDILINCHIKGVSFKHSVVAPITIINYIAADLAQRNKERSKKYLRYTEEILEQGYFSEI